MLTISEFARLGQVSPRMLRHYGETGLLEPAQIDARTGYRFYDVAQLARLRRLVALRELGFSLEQIRPILEEELPARELRGMLRIQKAQIEQNLAGEAPSPTPFPGPAWSKGRLARDMARHDVTLRRRVRLGIWVRFAARRNRR
jgi:DNA-binding transcriptional MerR regulator